jgi:NADH dehydrogenase/NADH:ubiquinone oxidoreductase subunit G
MEYWIDDKYFNEEKVNAVIIQKCFEIGIEIPCFCYHESLGIAGIVECV